MLEVFALPASPVVVSELCWYSLLLVSGYIGFAAMVVYFELCCTACLFVSVVQVALSAQPLG